MGTVAVFVHEGAWVVVPAGTSVLGEVTMTDRGSRPSQPEVVVTTEVWVGAVDA